MKRFYAAKRQAHPRRPFTGAWIETGVEVPDIPGLGVAPSRGRGLKRYARWLGCRNRRVAPSRGRGLKLLLLLFRIAACGSPLHGGVD